jgi:hypothetical protein
MSGRRWAWLAAAVALLAVAWWLGWQDEPARTAALARPAAGKAGAPSVAPVAAVSQPAPVAVVPPDPPSPIAESLNATEGNIRRDLELVNDVLTTWRTNFSGRGNPVGENREITAALAGDNPLRYRFIRHDHPAINAQGELCDRWGTPFRFHQISGDDMEIRSAGPDRRFGTADDAVLTPGGAGIR